MSESRDGGWTGATVSLSGLSSRGTCTPSVVGAAGALQEPSPGETENLQFEEITQQEIQLD